MHGKAQADQWQRYIREKMAKALSRGSAWFLFGLAFIRMIQQQWHNAIVGQSVSPTTPSGFKSPV